MDFSEVRFIDISKDKNNVIIGNVGTGIDVKIVLYALNKIMVAASHPVMFNPDPPLFEVLSEADKAALQDALSHAVAAGGLDPLWNTVLQRLKERLK